MVNEEEKDHQLRRLFQRNYRSHRYKNWNIFKLYIAKFSPNVIMAFFSKASSQRRKTAHYVNLLSHN